MVKYPLFLLFFLLSAAAYSQNNPGKSDGMDDMWGASAVSGKNLKMESARLFADGKYGMFIHFGLYSHLAGQWNGKTYYGIAEWIMSKNMADIPPEEYKKVAADFNPVDFDGRKIARLAKDAGMKYVIIGSKHHDGFAMFETKVDPFNIVDATPYGRDPMKELSAACRELGLGFGFYYSHYQDWTAPGGFRGPETFPNGTPATFEDYFYGKCLPQVKEICTNYGQIDFVWFDTPGAMKKELVEELVDVVRELQPTALLSSRVGHGMGDYASLGDMEVPPANNEGLWETCDTNNDSWGFTWYDRNFKGPKSIIRNLVSTVARGGTYLFNVGPDGKGVVPEAGADFLREAGRWIEKYPQVVFGAGSSPWGRALPWGDVTTQEHLMFLSVFDWPDDGKLYLPGLETEIVSARLLGKSVPEEIIYSRQDGWTVFNLPYTAPDSPVAVIELNLVSNASEVRVNPDYGVYPNIDVDLLSVFADVSGAEESKIRWMEKFGEWKHAHQITNWSEDAEASWKVNVNQPGYYYVDLCYKGEDKLVWRITTSEGDILQNQQPATSKYQFYPMGLIKFNEAGEQTISVSLIEGDGNTSSLEMVRIRPVVKGFDTVNPSVPAQKRTLAEDPIVVEEYQLLKTIERPWEDKSREELQKWAVENLHTKLTAKTTIDANSHPEWAWFRKLGLGIFLHWGLASVPPNNGDAWAMVWNQHRAENNMLIKPEEMFQIAEIWNPDKYDPHKWMAAAAKAGFGYAVLTARHHDGYCLWPSKHGNWNTGKYMNGRNLVKDYVEACRNNGIRIGLYYSGPNWFFEYKLKDFSWPPKGFNYKHEKVEAHPPLAALMGYDPPLPNDLDSREIEESAGQVKELLTMHGNIDMMWWDGNTIMTEKQLADIQPDIFVARGHIATPEGKHMGSDEKVKVTNESGWWWELCIKSENRETPYWHYNVDLETNHWNTSKLLSEYVRCRSLGGNLLVNVTPRPNGEMMDWYYKVCEEMALWMQHSREAVYDVDLDAPLPTLDKTMNYTTVKGNIWYAMPDNQNNIFIKDVHRPVSVTLLRTGMPLTYNYHDGLLQMILPESMRTELPDMVKIKFPL
jgi:alpha-L-fucosidase